MARVKAIPEGYHSMPPYLIVEDANAAIEFYKKALNAEEMVRMDKPDGKIGRAELRIGDSILMLADEYPELNAFSPKKYNGTPVFMHFYIEDVDQIYNQAIAQGARSLRPS